MRKKGSMPVDKTCPFCGKDVMYWPNYSPSTSSDYGNVEWVIPHSKSHKQYFHRSCYQESVRKVINHDI